MRKYVVYDESTGDIIKWGYCSDIDFGAGQKLKAGQKVAEVDVALRDIDVTHKVDINNIGKKLKKK